MEYWIDLAAFGYGCLNDFGLYLSFHITHKINKQCQNQEPLKIQIIMIV